VHLEKKVGGTAIGLDLTRTGARSIYGEVRVLKPGVKDPIALQKGIAVYTEVNRRHVSMPIAAAFREQAAGPVTVQYLETSEDGGSHVLAETQAVLR
jgi:hypothetical protein